MKGAVIAVASWWQHREAACDPHTTLLLALGGISIQLIDQVVSAGWTLLVAVGGLSTLIFIMAAAKGSVGFWNSPAVNEVASPRRLREIKYYLSNRCEEACGSVEIFHSEWN